MPLPSDSPSLSPRSQVGSLITKICVVRFVFLSLLLVPLALIWRLPQMPQNILVHFTPRAFFWLISAGLATNIILLSTWSRVRDFVRFLRWQLATDYVLSAILIIATGGIKSGFVFLLILLVFLYGRISGVKTGLWFAILTLGTMALVAIWQYHSPESWNLEPLTFLGIGFILGLQALALGLVVLLLRLGQGQEQQLLRDLQAKELALQQAELLKTLVFDWMESGLLVLDHRGSISAINRQAAIWAGLSDPREALGVPLHSYFPTLAKVWDREKNTASDRLEVLERKGDILFGLRLTPLPDSQGTLILFSDITPVRLLESRIRQMEKIEAVNKLAAGLAHEMKNPLAGIKASLQLSARGGLPEEDQQRLGQVIIRDIARLDSLLKNFLNFARPSQAEPKSIVLSDRLQESLSTLAPLYPDTEIVLDESLNGIVWNWDPNQFTQVTVNLLLNAFQAVQGRVAPRITISHRADASEDCLIIRDNGLGIEPQNMSHLFDPFFTTKPEGTGLGLSIAQRLAGQNNAWIDLVSVEGNGIEARIHQAPKTVSLPSPPLEDIRPI